MLLFPCDPVSPRRVDEHFAPEVTAAREAGMEISLIDHDALQRFGAAAEAVRRVPPSEDAVYRGWMLRSGEYAAFEEALAARGTRLRTSAEQYARAHELPGWYAQLAEFTPESYWTEGDDLTQLITTAGALESGAAVLRDWTKSLKHYWNEAAFIPDVADEPALLRVAERFLELRDDSFAGGFVLRRFEEFRGPELRTWWRHGRCVLRTAHPDTPDEAPEVPAGVIEALSPALTALDLPFVTLDLVARADGQWRVVELGDGQVSDRPSSCDPAELLVALTATD